MPGDILLLQPGAKIAADARIIEAVNLQIEEAALTGKSLPVEKQTAVLPGAYLALGDQTNTAYAGTAATYSPDTMLLQIRHGDEGSVLAFVAVTTLKERSNHSRGVVAFAGVVSGARQGSIVTCTTSCLISSRRGPAGLITGS